MFSNYQWLLIGVIIVCSCLVIYGSSSARIKEGFTPPPPTNITDDVKNVYFPNSNFIYFHNEGPDNQPFPFDPNEDSYPHSYSNYNDWTSPQSTTLSRTTNMFSDTKLPPPVGIASFNNRSFNQA